MVEPFTSYTIENDQAFNQKLKNAAKEVGDLRFAMGEIARDWFKSNKAQFSLKGSGQYPPLSEKYAERKRRIGGSLPILVGFKPNGGRSGRLMDSLTGTPNTDSVLRIGNASLVIGTKVPYGVYHQSDRPRSKIPLRKFLFIGPEAPKSAPSEITGRLERWYQIIDAELSRKMRKVNAS